MNFYFEIYLKDPQTGHGGYDIATGYVQADSRESALEIIKSEHPMFDEVIDLYQSALPPEN